MSVYMGSIKPNGFVVGGSCSSTYRHRHPELDDVKVAAQKYDAQINEALRDIVTSNARLTRLDPSVLNVSTMTIMCVLSRNKCNLTRVVGGFDQAAVKTVFEKHGLDPARARITRPDEQRAFQNSVIVQYVDQAPLNRKAVKIFCNGTLHITGPKTVSECIEVSNMMCEILDILHGIPDGTFRTTNFDVQLVNTNFMVPFRLDLPTLQELMFAHDNELDACYDPSMHAALNLKFAASRKRKVTIMTFDSGHVIITGVVAADELRTAYAFIASFLEQHIDAIKVLVPVRDPQDAALTTGRKRRTKDGSSSINGFRKKRTSPGTGRLLHYNTHVVCK